MRYLCSETLLYKLYRTSMAVETALCIWSSQHLNRRLWASHDIYSCDSWSLGSSRQWNSPVWTPQDFHGCENGFSWSSQHLNRHPQASHDLYSCEKWICRTSWQWKRCVRAPHDLHSALQWKGVYVSFPALKPSSTIITRPLQLWKVNLWTFMAVKYTCTSSTGLAWQCKPPLQDLSCEARGCPFVQDLHGSENCFTSFSCFT